MNDYKDIFVTETKYKSQRDNINPYVISDEKVFDHKGKYLFAFSDFEKYEHLLFDRVTKCFISGGSMFCGALHEKGYLNTDIDEIAYELMLDKHLKDKETRYHWEAHKRVINIFLKDSDIRFDFEKSTLSSIVSHLEAGFPVLCSLYIKPWYPSGRGHLTLAIGLRKDSEGKVLGIYLKDPFGKLLSNYKDHDGDICYIPIEDFKKAIKGPSKAPCHIGFIKKR